MLFLILILIMYEVARHFIGTLCINRSKYNGSDINSIFRYAYIFLEAFDSFIILFFIVKFSKDETYRAYANRITLIIIITLTKFSMIVLLNTINPTNRIISQEEWIKRFFQNLTMATIQILLCLIIFYFVKPRKKELIENINGT